MGFKLGGEEVKFCLYTRLNPGSERHFFVCACAIYLTDRSEGMWLCGILACSHVPFMDGSIHALKTGIYVKSEKGSALIISSAQAWSCHA